MRDRTRPLRPARILAQAGRQTRRQPLLWAPYVIVAMSAVLFGAALSAIGVRDLDLLAVVFWFMPVLALPLAAHGFAAGLHHDGGGDPPAGRTLARAAVRDLPEGAQALGVLILLALAGLCVFGIGVAWAWPVALMSGPAMIIDRCAPRAAIAHARSRLRFASGVWLLALSAGAVLGASAFVALSVELAGVGARVLYGPVFWALLTPPLLATYFARR